MPLSATSKPLIKKLINRYVRTLSFLPTTLVAPIIEQDYDLVIGSRVLGVRERGSLTPVQVFGNWLSTKLLKLIYNVDFTDLGPFRAINWHKLQELGMRDRNYGWTVEMQLRAAKKGLIAVTAALWVSPPSVLIC